MKQKYIGTKQIEAWPETRNGQEGYAVVYPGGYTSWSPKAEFEAAYLPMGEDSDGTKITDQMVNDFIFTVVSQKMGDKTTVVQATLRNGFELTESSACVDPANYDEDVARIICMGRINSKVYELLGMLLQTAVHGIKLPDPPVEPAEDVEETEDAADSSAEAGHEPGDQGSSPKSLDSEPE